MAFEYQSIKPYETKKVRLPLHPISSDPWLNWVENKFTSLLERRLFGINYDLDFRESIYQIPIRTNDCLENTIGRFKHYKASDHSAVIVLPQRGSGYNFAQLIASYLATNNISAYEIETPFRGSRLPASVKSVCNFPIDLNRLKVAFKQAVTETRGLVDLVREEKIGICGVSLGAIYASIAYGVDERISSACLILGGGNLADMIFESNDRFARHLRNYIIKKRLQKRS